MEQKSLHAQIQTQSLARSWVEVCRDRTGVMRNRSQETGDDGENPSEADPEHLRIPQGQLAEYRRGLQQVHNQNRL